MKIKIIKGGPGSGGARGQDGRYSGGGGSGEAKKPAAEAPKAPPATQAPKPAAMPSPSGKKLSVEALKTQFDKIANNDPQNRGGDYPRSNEPDRIGVYLGYDNNRKVSAVNVSAEFKNTDEKFAGTYMRNSMERYIARNKIDAVIESVKTSQTGDYADDWVTVDVYIKPK